MFLNLYYLLTNAAYIVILSTYIILMTEKYEGEHLWNGN